MIRLTHYANCLQGKFSLKYINNKWTKNTDCFVNINSKQSPGEMQKLINRN